MSIRKNMMKHFIVTPNMPRMRGRERERERDRAGERNLYDT
jgi:hypothetical protein